jgi:hypothetical protein
LVKSHVPALSSLISQTQPFLSKWFKSLQHKNVVYSSSIYNVKLDLYI